MYNFLVSLVRCAIALMWPPPHQSSHDLAGQKAIVRKAAARISVLPATEDTPRRSGQTVGVSSLRFPVCSWAGYPGYRSSDPSSKMRQMKPLFLGLFGIPWETREEDLGGGGWHCQPGTEYSYIHLTFTGTYYLLHHYSNVNRDQLKRRDSGSSDIHPGINLLYLSPR